MPIVYVMTNASAASPPRSVPATARTEVHVLLRLRATTSPPLDETPRIGRPAPRTAMLTDDYGNATLAVLPTVVDDYGSEVP